VLVNSRGPKLNTDGEWPKMLSICRLLSEGAINANPRFCLSFTWLPMVAQDGMGVSLGVRSDILGIDVYINSVFWHI